MTNLEAIERLEKVREIVAHSTGLNDGDHDALAHAIEVLKRLEPKEPTRQDGGMVYYTKDGKVMKGWGE